MGWTTLTLRKQNLKADINLYEFQDIQLSRQLRAVSRHLTYDQSVQNAAKTEEVNAAKETYDSVRKQRPDIDSDEYADWKQQYDDAQTDYQAQSQDIKDYYDSVMKDLEDESADEENAIQDEQTSLEAQLQAIREELEVVNEQIKSDISSDKITLS